VFGQVEFPFINLDGTNGTQVAADGASSTFGTAVTTVGDMNGDGYDEFVITEPSLAPPAAGESACYIVYGGEGFSPSHLISPNTSSPMLMPAFPNGVTQINFPSYAGYNIADIGDFNGDGMGDFIVSGVQSTSLSPVGVVYLVLGRVQANVAQTATISIFLNADDASSGGPRILGSTIEGIGDLNGDGLDDFAIGAPLQGDSSTITTGAIYIVYGTSIPSSAPIALDAPSVFNVTKIIGSDLSLPGLGTSFAGVEDTNGDGYDEFAFWLPRGDGQVGLLHGTNGIESIPQIDADANFGASYPDALIQAAGGNVKILSVHGSEGYDPNGASFAAVTETPAGNQRLQIWSPSQIAAAENAMGPWGGLGAYQVTFQAGTPVNFQLIESIGDLNGDMRSDFLFTFTNVLSEAVAVAVYSRANSFLPPVTNINLSTLASTPSNEVRFGYFPYDSVGGSFISIGGGGDIDGDGVCDFVLGALGTNSVSAGGGNASVFAIFDDVPLYYDVISHVPAHMELVESNQVISIELCDPSRMLMTNEVRVQLFGELRDYTPVQTSTLTTGGCFRLDLVDAQGDGWEIGDKITVLIKDAHSLNGSSDVSNYQFEFFVTGNEGCAMNFSNTLSLAGSSPMAVTQLDFDSDFEFLSHAAGNLITQQFFQAGSSPLATVPGIAQILPIDTGRDGVQDIFILNSSSRDVYGLTVDATGAASSIQQLTSAGSIDRFAVGDVNGDNLLDLYTLSGTNIGYYPATGIGLNFGAFVSVQGFGPLSSTINILELADVNLDGTLDVIFEKTIGANTNALECWLNDGLGNFTVSYSANYTDVLEIAVADFTGDLKPDLMLLRDPDFMIGLTRIHVFEGDALGGFASNNQSFFSSAQVSDFDIGDLDQDGDLDAVISSPVDQSWVYLNTGASFQPASSLISFPSADGVDLADVNRDGALDIVLDTTSSGIQLYETFCADLSLTKTVSVMTDCTPDELEYTMIISNKGSVDVNNVTLLDPLISNLTLSTFPANCSNTATDLECSFATIPAGGAVTVLVYGAGEFIQEQGSGLPPSAPTWEINNSAYIVDDYGDAFPADNEDDAVLFEQPGDFCATNVVITYSNLYPRIEVEFSKPAKRCTLEGSLSFFLQGDQSGAIPGTFSFPTISSVVFQGTERLWPAELMTLELTRDIYQITPGGGLVTLKPHSQEFIAPSLACVPGPMSQFRFTGQILSDGGPISDLRLADIDESGSLDLILKDNNNATILYKGSGTGSFTMVSNAPGTSTINSYPVSTADLNRDGLIDFADWVGGTQGVHHVNQGGGFNFSNLFFATSNMVGTSVLDLHHYNRDHAGSFDTVLSRFTGAGAASGLDLISYPTTDLNLQEENSSFIPKHDPIEIDSGDVNGDGHIDLVFIDVSGGRLEVKLGDGSGGSLGFLANAYTDTPEQLRVADLNFDGFEDVVILSDQGLKVIDGRALSLTNPSPEILSYTYTMPGSEDLEIGDMDSDGELDLVVSRFGSPLVIWYGSGSLTYTRVTTSISGAREIELGDVDGDGALDILAAAGDFGGQELHVYLNESCLPEVDLAAIKQVLPPVTTGTFSYEIGISNVSALAITSQVQVTDTVPFGATLDLVSLTNSYPECLNSTVTQVVCVVTGLQSGGVSPLFTVHMAGASFCQTNTAEVMLTDPFYIDVVPENNFATVTNCGGFCVTAMEFQGVDAAGNPIINVQFTRALDSSSVTSNMYLLGAQSGYQTLVLRSVSGLNATLEMPSGALVAGEQYTVVLTSNLVSTGNANLKPYSDEFFHVTSGCNGLADPIWILAEQTNSSILTASILTTGVRIYESPSDMRAVFVSDTSGPDNIYVVNGDGFSDFRLTGAFYDSEAVDVGDLDNDGLSDMVVVDNARLRVFDDMSATAPVTHLFTSPYIGAASADVHLADLNHDGILDAIVALYNPSTPLDLLVYLGVGNAGATPIEVPVADPTKGSVLRVDSGDYNGDGNIDLGVVTYDGVDTYSSIWLGDGLGGFSQSVYTTVFSGSPFDIDCMLADLYHPTGGGMHGHDEFIIKAGLFTTITNSSGFSDVNLSTISASTFRVADLNGDGNLDIVSVETNRLMIRYFDDAFSTFSSKEITGVFTSLDVGDVDGDGRVDLVAAGVSNRSVFLNTCITEVDVELVKSSIPSMNANEIAFNLAVSNLSTQAVDRLEVVDLLPSGYEFSSILSSEPGVLCTLGSGMMNLACVVTNFGGGSNFVITVNVLPLAGQSCLTNSAEVLVTSPNVDTNLANNISVVTNCIANVCVVTNLSHPVSDSIPVMGPVRLQLSRPVLADAFASNVFLNGNFGGSYPVNVSVMAGGLEVEFTPATNFFSGEEVILTIASGVTAINGQTLKPYVFEFLTATANDCSPTATFSLESSEIVSNPIGPVADLEIVDINNDRKLEFGYIARNGGGRIFENVGPLSYTTKFNQGGTAVLFQMEFADFFANGDVGLGVVGQGGGWIWSITNAPLYTLELNSGLLGSSQDGDLRFHDVNADGMLESAFVNLNNESAFFNNNSGSFVKQSLGTNLHLVDSGDIDADGDIDLVSFQKEIFDFSLRAILGSNLPIDGSEAVTGLKANIPQAVDLRVLDANGDGREDIFYLLNLPAVDQFNALLSSPNGFVHSSYGITTGLSAPMNLVDMDMGDINGDNQIDVVIAHSNTGFISLHLGFTSSTFTVLSEELQGPVSGSGFNTVDLGDMDGDGDLDLITSRNTGEIDLYINRTDTQIDLSITQVMLPSFDPNFPVEFQITVSNAGPKTATNSTFIQQFQGGMLPDMSRLAPLSNTMWTGILMGDLPNLGANSNIQFSIFATLPADDGMTYSNLVFVMNSACQDDVDSSNNDASISIMTAENCVLSINRLGTSTRAIQQGDVIQIVFQEEIDLNDIYEKTFLHGHQGGIYSNYTIVDNSSITPGAILLTFDDEFFPGEELMFTFTSNILSLSGFRRICPYQLDMVAATETCQSGENEFVFRENIAYPLMPGGIRLFDEDKDGQLEIVIAENPAQPMSGIVQKYHFDSSGSASNYSNANWPFSYEIDAGEFANNGQVGLSFAGYQDAVSVSTSGNYPSLSAMSNSQMLPAHDVHLADMDFDGQLDLITAMFGTNESTRIVFNGNSSPTQTLSPPTSIAVTNSYYAIDVGTHFLNTRTANIVALRYESIPFVDPDGGAMTFGFSTGGTYSADYFLPDGTAAQRMSSPDAFVDIRLVDFSGIGFHHMVVLAEGSDSIWTYDPLDISDDPVKLSPADPLIDPKELNFGDMDGDGRLDLVIADGTNGCLIQYMSGQSLRTRSQRIPGNFNEVEVGDVDGDGDLDLVLAGADVQVWLNQSQNKADVSIAGTAAYGGNNPVYPIQYSMIISNAGTGIASNTSLVVEMPGGMSADAMSFPSGYGCSVTASSTIYCASIPTIGVGTTIPFEFFASQPDATSMNDPTVFEIESGLCNQDLFQTNNALNIFVAETPMCVVSHSLETNINSVSWSDDIVVSLDQEVQSLGIESQIFLYGSQGGYYPFGVQVLGTDVVISPATNFFAGEEVTLTFTTNVIGRFVTGHMCPYTIKFFAETLGCVDSAEVFFRQDQDLGRASITGGIRISDYTGDGLLDVFVAKRYQTTPSLEGRMFIRSTITNDFVRSEHSALCGYEVDSGDFNQDGLMDIVVSCQDLFAQASKLSPSWGSSGLLGVLPNNLTVPGSTDLHDVLVIDVDSDGDLDLVNAASGSVAAVQFNTLVPDVSSFTNLADSIAGSYYAVASGDFNQDGTLDLSMLQSNPGGAPSVPYLSNFLYGDGAGGFSNSTFLSGANVNIDTQMGDLNGDGQSDIIVLREAVGGGYELVVSYAPLSFLGLPGLVDPREFTLGDLDGDGDLDVVVADMDQGVMIYLFEGGASIKEQQYPGSYSEVELGDLDDDGDLDIVAGGINNFVYLRECYDVSLTKQVTALGPFAELEAIPFEIILSNGSDIAISGTLLDLVPAGSSIQSIQLDGVPCPSAQCLITGLAAGSSVTVLVDVVTSCAGIYTNTAKFESSATWGASTNMVEAVFQVVQPTVSLIQTVLPANGIVVGSLITNFVTITNVGSVDLIDTMATIQFDSTYAYLVSPANTNFSLPLLNPGSGFSTSVVFEVLAPPVNNLGSVGIEIANTCRVLTNASVEFFHEPLADINCDMPARSFGCEVLPQDVPPPQVFIGGVLDVAVYSNSVVLVAGCNQEVEITWVYIDSFDRLSICTEVVEFVESQAPVYTPPTSLWFGCDPATIPAASNAFSNRSCSEMLITDDVGVTFVSNCFLYVERTIVASNTCEFSTNVVELWQGYPGASDFMADIILPTNRTIYDVDLAGSGDTGSPQIPNCLTTTSTDNAPVPLCDGSLVNGYSFEREWTISAANTLNSCFDPIVYTQSITRVILPGQITLLPSTDVDCGTTPLLPPVVGYSGVDVTIDVQLTSITGSCYNTLIYEYTGVACSGQFAIPATQTVYQVHPIPQMPVLPPITLMDDEPEPLPPFFTNSCGPVVTTNISYTSTNQVKISGVLCEEGFDRVVDYSVAIFTPGGTCHQNVVQTQSFSRLFTPVMQSYTQQVSCGVVPDLNLDPCDFYNIMEQDPLAGEILTNDLEVVVTYFDGLNTNSILVQLDVTNSCSVNMTHLWVSTNQVFVGDSLLAQVEVCNDSPFTITNLSVYYMHEANVSATNSIPLPDVVSGAASGYSSFGSIAPGACIEVEVQLQGLLEGAVTNSAWATYSMGGNDFQLGPFEIRGAVLDPAEIQCPSLVITNASCSYTVPDLRGEIVSQCPDFSIADVSQLPLPGSTMQGPATKMITLEVLDCTGSIVCEIPVMFECAPVATGCPASGMRFKNTSDCKVSIPDFQRDLEILSGCSNDLVYMQIPSPGESVQGPGVFPIQFVASDCNGAVTCLFDYVISCPTTNRMLEISCPDRAVIVSNCTYVVPNLRGNLAVVSSCEWFVDDQSIPVGTLLTGPVVTNVEVIVTNRCGLIQVCEIELVVLCPDSGDCILDHLLRAPIASPYLLPGDLAYFEVVFFNGSPDPVTPISLTYDFDPSLFQLEASYPSSLDLGNQLVIGSIPTIPSGGEFVWQITMNSMGVGAYANRATIRFANGEKKTASSSGGIVEDLDFSIQCPLSISSNAPDCLFSIPDLSTEISILAGTSTLFFEQSPSVGSFFVGLITTNITLTITDLVRTQICSVSFSGLCSGSDGCELYHSSSRTNVIQGEQIEFEVVFTNAESTSVQPLTLLYSYDPSLMRFDSGTPSVTSIDTNSGIIFYTPLSTVLPGDTLYWNLNFTAIEAGTFEHIATIDLPNGDQKVRPQAGSISQPNQAITGMVWFDHDSSGYCEPREIKLAGIPVSLMDLSGHMVSTTTTIYNGSYTFSQPVGVYDVHFELTGVSTMLGVDVAITPSMPEAALPNSDVNPVTASMRVTNSIPTKVDLGLASPWPKIDIVHTVYLGHNSGAGCSGTNQVMMVPGAALTYCFEVRNLGAAPLSNVVIESESLNLYLTTNVLGVGQVAMYHTEVSAETYGSSSASVIGYGGANHEMVQAVDQAWRVPISDRHIGDTVWLDANLNAIRETNEVGIAGQLVDLYDSSGLFLERTMTDSAGRYLFTGLDMGQYEVRVAPQLGLQHATFQDRIGDVASQQVIALGSTHRMDIDILLQPSPDTDGDGLSDDWENAYGLGNPFEDADGDGQSNFNEYTAGTNPTDPASCLHITNIRILSTGAEIYFSTVPQKQYTIQRRDTELGPWFLLGQKHGADALNGVQTFVDPAALRFPSVRAYRVMVSP